jgi:hypothetical protein
MIGYAAMMNNTDYVDLGSSARVYPSAKCKLVWKEHAYLPDTFVALTSAFKYFQMLIGPPGALQSACRLCISILRCLEI